jgi:hypothetical protein
MRARGDGNEGDSARARQVCVRSGEVVKQMGVFVDGRVAEPALSFNSGSAVFRGDLYWPVTASSNCRQACLPCSEPGLTARVVVLTP